MGFWIFMLIIELLIPFMMIFFGTLFYKSAPKKINMFFGYRSSMSMKNEETWEFAHNYCGNLWKKIGWAMLIVSVITMLLVMGKDNDIIENASGVLSIVQLVLLIASIFPTEIALRKTFDKEGNRIK